MVMSRRDALVRVGSAGVVLAGAGALAAIRHDRGGYGIAEKTARRQTRDYSVATEGPADFAVAELAPGESEKSAARLVQKAVAAVGGMGRFISRGDVVVVKPNIGWDRMPLHAANTNPEVVSEVVRLVYDAGAKHVVVTDASCNEPNRCFQRSGIWKSAYDVGAEIIIPAEHRFRSMRLKGEVLDEWPVFTPLVNADKLINIPVAKHHNLAKYTGAMKNWYGSLGGRRNRLHQNIDVSVADLATFLKPTLTVVDAVRVLMRNGPQGGNIADAKEMWTVIVTTDQVAADAFGCTLIDVLPDEVPYLRMAEERNLGTRDWKSLHPVFV
jgi:uncharacterized protein (DUF362 family)